MRSWRAWLAQRRWKRGHFPPPALAGVPCGGMARGRAGAAWQTMHSGMFWQNASHQLFKVKLLLRDACSVCTVHCLPSALRASIRPPIGGRWRVRRHPSNAEPGSLVDSLTQLDRESLGAPSQQRACSDASAAVHVVDVLRCSLPEAPHPKGYQCHVPRRARAHARTRQATSAGHGVVYCTACLLRRYIRPQTGQSCACCAALDNITHIKDCATWFGAICATAQTRQAPVIA